MTYSSMVLKCVFSNALYDSSASGVVGMGGSSDFEGLCPPSRPGSDHVLPRRFNVLYDSRPAMFAACGSWSMGGGYVVMKVEGRREDRM